MHSKCSVLCHLFRCFDPRHSTVKPLLQALLTQHTILSTGIWHDKGCYVNKADSLALPDPFETNVNNLQGNENILSTAVKRPKLSATLYLALTTRIAGQAVTPRTRMTRTASPQNALSARLVMDPVRRSTETCLFTAIMNNRGKLSVMWQNLI